MTGKGEFFPEPCQNGRYGCPHLYAGPLAAEGETAQRGHKTAYKFGRKQPEPVFSGYVQSAPDDEFRLGYAAAGNEGIVLNQPAEKAGRGDKHDKPERRDPPGILPAGKKGQYDRCGVISGKAEAAYHAGADEAYDHSFQSQKGSVEPLCPMFAEMSIHEKS